MLVEKLLRLLRSRTLTAEKLEAEAEKILREFEERYAQGKYRQKTTDSAGARPNPKTVSEAEKYYQVLEVPPGTEFAEIKVAYKKLVKKYHPDKFPQDEAKRRIAETVTQRLNEALAYFENREEKLKK
jgi:DnaJ-domain-containing protein 1